MTPKKRKRPSKARQHTTVETITTFGFNVRMGPPGLIVFASHFLHAARSAEPPPTANGFQLVRSFLVCRALELSLKAFLSLKGISLVKLAGGQFAHNLESLVLQAEKNDLGALVTLEGAQRDEIIRASKYYAEKVLEYPALTEALRAYPHLADPNLLIAAADALTSALTEPCLHAE
jgi:hypothetical protein